MEIIKIEKEYMKGNILNFDINSLNGIGWVAGGSIRRWFNGEPYNNSDIDIFLKEEDYISEVIENLKLKNELFTTKNSITFLLNDQKIQIIKTLFSENIEDLFDHFDFKHCQFAYNTEGVFSTPEAIICALRKRMVIHNIQFGYELDTLRRAFKYQKSGYIPCFGTFQNLAMSFKNLSEEQIQQLESMSEE